MKQIFQRGNALPAAFAVTGFLLTGCASSAAPGTATLAEAAPAGAQIYLAQSFGCLGGEQPGDIKTIEAGQIQVTAPWNRGERANELVYTAPSGYAIVDYRLENVTTENGGIKVYTYARDARFISADDLRSAYDRAISRAGEGHDAAAQADLAQEYAAHEALRADYAWADNAIRVAASAVSQGTRADPRKGWVRAELMVDVMCVGTDI